MIQLNHIRVKTIEYYKDCVLPYSFNFIDCIVENSYRKDSIFGKSIRQKQRIFFVKPLRVN